MFNRINANVHHSIEKKKVLTYWSTYNSCEKLLLI